MPRRTLADALSVDSRICEALNIVSTDSRAVAYINRFIERAITRGHFWGTTQKYSVSVTAQLLTLPPQFAVAEKINVAYAPVPLRNDWYEFNSAALGGFADPNTPPLNLPIIETGGQAISRGNFATFKDITSGSKFRLQCDIADDVGISVLVLGYDANGNWIRTKVAGVWQDGEPIVLAQSPGTLSTNTWSKISDVQKPRTNGQIWGYGWDGTTNTLIANYQYWEVRPSYPRYLLPTLPNNATQIDLIGKLCFVPVSQNTDYLIIGNLEAIRLGVMAIKLEEEYDSRSSVYMNGGMLKNGVRIEGAIPILEDELRHYMGSGFKFAVTVDTQFGEIVPSLI